MFRFFFAMERKGSFRHPNSLLGPPRNAQLQRSPSLRPQRLCGNPPHSTCTLTRPEGNSMLVGFSIRFSQSSSVSKQGPP